jgi:hypothetical protein
VDYWRARWYGSRTLLYYARFSFQGRVKGQWNLDLQYCNSHNRYDFSTDEGFYYPGCDPKYYHINDLSPKAFRRAYVAALFTENKRWLTLIENYHMIVPGSRKNKRDAARDLVAKEHLREQVSPDTYEDRKAFFEAWKDASCCADDCEQYCDECSNKNIHFKSVPTFGLDADVRRYITKYWRYQTDKKEVDYLVNQKKFPAIKLKGSKRCYHTPSVKKWLLEHQVNQACENGV